MIDHRDKVGNGSNVAQHLFVPPELSHRIATDVVVASCQCGRGSVGAVEEHRVSVSASCNVIDQIGNRPPVAPAGLVEITRRDSRKSVDPRLLGLIQRLIDLHERHATATSHNDATHPG